MGAVRTVSVAIKMQVQDYVAGAGKVVATTKAMGAEVDTLAKNNKAKFNDVTKMAAGAGLALVGVAAFAVKAAYDFDKQMSEVQAVSNATAGQFETLRDAAIEAGKVTAFSATDAAKAEAELAKAGVSTADILGGALKGSLSLAAAGQMDLADAATITAQAMNIFNLKGSAVTHIADVLASASNASAADMQGLGDSLKQGGLVAAQTGLTLEDTTGVLAAFADHALIGSDAGTSLKTMLQALQAPSAKTAGLMQSLGIDMYDTSGKFIGITELAGQLQKQLGGLTQAQRDNALAQIFGSDATRSATILYNEGSRGIQDYIDKVNVQGAAAKTASTKMNNLAGDVEQLKGSLETLAIESGGGVTSGLRGMAEAATGTVNAIAGLPPALTATLTILSGLGGVALLGATGFVKARKAGMDFMKTLTEMGPAGEKAAGVIGKIGSVAGKLGVAGIVVGGLIEGFHALDVWAASKSAPTARNIDKLTVSLSTLATYGRDLNGELTTTFGKGFTGLSIDVQQIQDATAALGKLEAAKKVADKSFAGRGEIYTNLQIATVGDSTKQQKSDVNALDTALSQMATNGGAAQAKIAFQDLAAAQGWTDLETKNAMAMLPKYNATLAGVAAANTGAAQGFGDAASQVKTLTTSLSDAIAKGETFDSVWSELNGALLSSDKAGLAAHQAIDNVTKTLKDNNNAWKGNSEAAQASRVAIGDAAEAAAKAADAKFKETGSVSDANKVYDDYIGQLRKSLLAAGLSRTAVDKLLTAYANMPASVTTTVKAPGLAAANDTASGYYAIMNHLDGKKVTTDVRTRYTTVGHGPNKAVLNRWGGAYEHAADGLLRDASMYSPVNPGRYMIAEPQTGGEAFVPKNGDYGRSMSILGQAASWYGARVVSGGGGGGAVQATVRLSVDPSAPRALMELIRVQVDLEGGDPVKSLTPR